MHSLLDRSVYREYGCFGVDFQSLLNIDTTKMFFMMNKARVYMTN